MSTKDLHKVILLFLLVAASVSVWSSELPVVDSPDHTYYVYVCAESDDEVAVVRYGPEGIEVVKTIVVGSFPAETEGPHGIQVAPDGHHWYVSMSHGFPFGSVHKYATDTDQWLGDVSLGMYPATLDVASSTGLLYVVNFDLHGPLQPSTISVVETETMIEVSRIASGVRPHGGRLSRDESMFYAVNVMGYELVEIDATGFNVERRLTLGDGVQPTWVTKPTAGGRVFVTGNNVARIFEVDIQTWQIVRSFETGPGPYNLAVTPDESTLIVTYKTGAAVGFWDLRSGLERARIETSRTIPHGVVVTPDGDYAFVTLEGVGSEPGTVEVYHVASAERVAAIDVGKQAGGLAFWKSE
tara:strand:+ start:10324 stop:11388 length:1065 start_codon:yes stop_codon:yes gene_type:complete